jgi:hypothetical protein
MAFRLLGNCPEVEFTPEVETLDHFTSQEGVQKKDKTVPLKSSGTLRIVMDELVADNLALVIGGEVSTNTAGDKEVDILANTVIAAKVRVVGTNDVGRKITADFNRVEFTPSSALSLISEEFATFEATGEVLAVAGKFGIITFANPGTAGDTPPDIENYTILKGIVSIELIP